MFIFTDSRWSSSSLLNCILQSYLTWCTLQQLLEHTVNKEDIDYQAQDMEQKLALDQYWVNRIHPKKNWKPKDKHKPKPSHNNKRESTCQFCGIDHKEPRSNCPASGKTCGLCSKKSHFACMCKGKKNDRERFSIKITVNRKVCPRRGTGGILRFGFHLPGQSRQTSPSKLCHCWSLSKRKDGSWFMFYSQHRRWAKGGKTPDLTQEQDCSAPHRYPFICICTKRTCNPGQMFWCQYWEYQHWKQKHSPFCGCQGNHQVLTSPKSGYMHWARIAIPN